MPEKAESFEKERNAFCINVLLWMMFVPNLNELVVPLTRHFIGETIGNNISKIMYGAVLAFAGWKAFRYGLLKRGLPLVAYLQILGFFELSKKLHPERFGYYTDTSMQLIKLFFLPLSLYLVTAIKDWSVFPKKAYEFAKWACVASCLKLAIKSLEMTGYMNFSYVFLPFVGIAIYNAVNNKEAKHARLVVCADFVIMLMYGARSPVFFSIILLLGLILLNDLSKKKAVLMFFCIVAASAIYFNSEAIIDAMSNSSLFENSYFLKNLQNGTLFKSSGRDAIYVACREYISTMGLEVNGLFYDRIILNGIGTYPHNIVYEILIQFGKLFGTAILVILTVFILKTFFKADKIGKKLLFMFFVTLMGRFFVSGSYVQEFRFYVFLCITYSISKAYSERRPSNAS